MAIYNGIIYKNSQIYWDYYRDIQSWGDNLREKWSNETYTSFENMELNHAIDMYFSESKSYDKEYLNLVLMLEHEKLLPKFHKITSEIGIAIAKYR